MISSIELSGNFDDLAYQEKNTEPDVFALICRNMIYTIHMPSKSVSAHYFHESHVAPPLLRVLQYFPYDLRETGWSKIQSRASAGNESEFE